MVAISPTAIEEIKRLKLNRQVPDSPLRLSVDSGGCFGLYYSLKFDEQRPTDDNLSLEETESDHLIEVDGVHLVVNSKSWKYIEHLQLDYSEDLMGGGFRFHHPQLKKTCGCGISFAESTEV